MGMGSYVVAQLCAIGTNMICGHYHGEIDGDSGAAYEFGLPFLDIFYAHVLTQSYHVNMNPKHNRNIGMHIVNTVNGKILFFTTIGSAEVFN